MNDGYAQLGGQRPATPWRLGIRNINNNGGGARGLRSLLTSRAFCCGPNKMARRQFKLSRRLDFCATFQSNPVAAGRLLANENIVYVSATGFSHTGTRAVVVVLAVVSWRHPAALERFGLRTNHPRNDRTRSWTSLDSSGTARLSIGLEYAHVLFLALGYLAILLRQFARLGNCRPTPSTDAATSPCHSMRRFKL